MTSELKSATSRANGAKSRGPKTAETREKSSRNSLDHGFTAKKTIVLACENPEQFQELLDDYAATYQPGSPVEMDLVNEMVACRWRMQRLRMIETALLDNDINREASETETDDTPVDPGYRIASAFRRIVDESRAISLASRYESRLHRIHERSHRTLRELQQSRIQQTAEPLSPAPAQPETPVPSPDGPQLESDSSVAQSLPSNSDEKSRNEPTAATPAAIQKDRQHLLIVGHRGFRRIETKRFLRLGQLKTA
jgi:hypothetical protein